MDVVRSSRSTLRVGADDEQLGVLLLQVPRQQHRAAGPDGEDDGVDLAAGLLPELGPRRLVVRLGPPGSSTGQLVGAGDLLGEPVRDRVVALWRLGLDGGRADSRPRRRRPEQARFSSATLSGITKTQR